MTYGGTLFEAYYNAHRLPEWLPKDGLVYFDDFAELRPFALTGQAYSQKDGATAAYTIATLGGRKCLYKADADNQLTIGLQMPVSDHTWGVFAYDNLGTCTNQQVFDLRSTAGGVESTDILRFRSASNNIGLFNWRDSQSHSSISVSGKYAGGAWHLILGWQGASWWGIGFDEAANLKTAQKERGGCDVAFILPATTYGVGIRNAFCYNRILTDAELLQIYTHGL